MMRAGGFTLVEMLITMALLSALVLIGTSALNFFLQRWDGQVGNFNQTLEHTREMVLVKDVLDGLLPYMAYHENEPGIYFEGNRNGFVAVSSRSLFGNNSYAVVRFSVNQNVDRTFDLLYEESAMEEDVLRSTNQLLVFSEPLVLMRNLIDVSFDYFGWSSVREKFGVDGQPPMPATWFSAYDGFDTSLSPLKTRLVFTRADGSYEILSLMSAERGSLVSRYLGSRSRRRNEDGELLDIGDQCCAE